MKDIALRRVEARYTVTDLIQLERALATLGFQKTQFSDRAITLTYFCDTTDLSLPASERIKIRTYTNTIPTYIDHTGTYKLNFKYHLEHAISKKESHTGVFDNLIALACKKTGLDITPMMAMSYTRDHYTQAGDAGVRITIDQDITFYRIVENMLQPFTTYDTTFLECKYDPDAPHALNLVSNLLAMVPTNPAESKKNTMYTSFKRQFGTQILDN